jgi:hypothetical protein
VCVSIADASALLKCMSPDMSDAEVIVESVQMPE